MTKTQTLKERKTAMRLKVAKDVLLQIKNKKVSIMTGTFMGGQATDRLADGLSYADDESSQDVLCAAFENNLDCKVCAKGALFVSHILVYNKISAYDAFWTGSNSVYQLMPEFTRKLLNEFEYLFELNEKFFPKVGKVAKYYLKQFAAQNSLQDMSDEKRLIFLLKLFIKNKGQFLVLP